MKQADYDNFIAENNRKLFMKKPNILIRPLLRKPMPIRNPADRPGRNQKCPCNSGLKFKKCCKDIPTLVARLHELIDVNTEEENVDCKH